MPDKVFIDTNILIYSFLDNDQKRHEAAVQLLSSLLEKEVLSSTQVMSEVYSALSKNRIQYDVIANFLSDLEENMNIAPVNFGTVKKVPFPEEEIFLFLFGQPDFHLWKTAALLSALKTCSMDRS